MAIREQLAPKKQTPTFVSIDERQAEIMTRIVCFDEYVFIRACDFEDPNHPRGVNCRHLLANDLIKKVDPNYARVVPPVAAAMHKGEIIAFEPTKLSYHMFAPRRGKEWVN